MLFCVLASLATFSPAHALHHAPLLLLPVFPAPALCPTWLSFDSGTCLSLSCMPSGILLLAFLCLYPLAVLLPSSCCRCSWALAPFIHRLFSQPLAQWFCFLDKDSLHAALMSLRPWLLSSCWCCLFCFVSCMLPTAATLRLEHHYLRSLASS